MNKLNLLIFISVLFVGEIMAAEEGQVIICKTREEFDQQLDKASGKLVVIDFMASWCGPCRLIDPRVVAMAADYPDVVFLKVDVDEVPDVAAKYGVRAMPTFMFLRDMTKVGEVVGANPSALKAGIEKYRA